MWVLESLPLALMMAFLPLRGTTRTLSGREAWKPTSPREVLEVVEGEVGDEYARVLVQFN